MSGFDERLAEEVRKAQDSWSGGSDQEWHALMASAVVEALKPKESEQVDPVHFGEEYYGFRWGPMVVERSGEYRMGKAKAGPRMTKVLSVIPDDSSKVEVHVSSSGKSVRVFRNGKELT